jgi:hypothetical protein
MQILFMDLGQEFGFSSSEISRACAGLLASVGKPMLL